VFLRDLIVSAAALSELTDKADDWLCALSSRDMGGLSWRRMAARCAIWSTLLSISFTLLSVSSVLSSGKRSEVGTEEDDLRSELNDSKSKK